MGAKGGTLHNSRGGAERRVVVGMVREVDSLPGYSVSGKFDARMISLEEALSDYVGCQVRVTIEVVESVRPKTLASFRLSSPRGEPSRAAAPLPAWQPPWGDE